MHLTSAILIYFSPTRTTRTILEGIAQGMAGVRVAHLDLTPPAARTDGLVAAQQALALIGAPVYGGRVPLAAVERLRRLRGQDMPAALVVVYGNRAYEDALLELRDLAVEVGFRPVAAGAFIGEHSFSRAATPIAVGRPDPDDLKQARAFGERIQHKLRSVPAVDGMGPLRVPGHSPYKEWRALSQISPVRDAARCVMCGACVTVCPMGAIAIGETVATDSSRCIVCCACVKQCPEGARVVTDVRIRQLADRLTLNCRTRQAPETYL
jgi:ferredoxin